eukprot:g34326.t1
MGLFFIIYLCCCLPRCQAICLYLPIHASNLFAPWVLARVRIEAEEAMGAMIKFAFTPKSIKGIGIPEAFADVPGKVCAPPVPDFAATTPESTGRSPWLPFWWVLWETATSRMDIDAFIRAGVVILTAAPGSIGNWAEAPWATHCWWAGEKDNGRPPPAEVPRIVLADFRAIRGRGRDIIELVALPGRHRVRQVPKIRLPAFEGETATYKTPLRLPALVALANGCPKLSETEKEWFRNACAAQTTVLERLFSTRHCGSEGKEMEGVNDLTPRMDEGVAYFTFAQHMTNIAKLGRGCYAFGGDIQDAYRQIGVRAEDLYQQVSAAWSDEGRRHFFVELCGKFGAVAAGDNFARFMALLKVIAEHLPDQCKFLFDNFVDNLISEAKEREGAIAEVEGLFQQHRHRATRDRLRTAVFIPRVGH